MDVCYTMTEAGIITWIPFLISIIWLESQSRIFTSLGIMLRRMNITSVLDTRVLVVLWIYYLCTTIFEKIHEGCCFCLWPMVHPTFHSSRVLFHNSVVTRQHRDYYLPLLQIQRVGCIRYKHCFSITFHRTHLDFHWKNERRPNVINFLYCYRFTFTCVSCVIRGYYVQLLLMSCESL